MPSTGNRLSGTSVAGSRRPPTACSRRLPGPTRPTSSTSRALPPGPGRSRLKRGISTPLASGLLDEGGYRDPDGDGPQPRLTLTLRTTNQEFQRLQAAVIQENLKQVGINVEIRTYEFATLYADVLKGNFQMYTLQWVGGAVADPDILRRVFHSQMVPPAGFNRGHFSDAEVDRLLDEAGRATDLESRRQTYARVQQRLAELVPYISLWHKTNFALAQPELDGVQLTPAADLRFLKNVSRRSAVARLPAN